MLSIFISIKLALRHSVYADSRSVYASDTYWKSSSYSVFKKNFIS